MKVLPLYSKPVGELVNIYLKYRDIRPQGIKDMFDAIRNFELEMRMLNRDTLWN